MGRKLKDYSGQQYGCWEVIERDFNPTSKSHETFWIAKCKNCGRIASVRKTDLDRCPQHCNNCKGEVLASWTAGEQYGLLTIIGDGKKDPHHNYVKVKCECGSPAFDIRLDHLRRSKGTVSCGCIKTSYGELKIKEILDKNNIIYQQQYRIKDFNIHSPFDFAIFNENGELIKLIEFDGEQHYGPVDFFGGEGRYQLQLVRDRAKDEYCQAHHIFLDRISYLQINDINLEMLLRTEKSKKDLVEELTS